jgi:hypothetical protein
MKGTILAIGLVLGGFSAAAHATLFVRGTDSKGSQLIYDDDLNITWYDRSMTIDLGGTGTYWTALGWASGLIVNFNGINYDGWRLTEMWTWQDTQVERTGELRHLYATELGNSIDGYGSNYSPFLGLRDTNYWVQDFDRPNVNAAWLESFRMDQGHYDTAMDEWYFNAIVVRSGDVAAPGNPVPDSATWFSLVTGLAGLAAFRRRFARE